MILGAQMFLRPFVLRYIKYVFWSSIIFIFGFSIYYSFLQYDVWQYGGGVLKYLLPPYQGISYFVFYITTRIWLPYVISLVFAIIFFFLVKKYNKKRGGHIFYEEEYWILSLSIFLSGWPGLFFFFIFFFLFFIITTFINQIILKKEKITSTYYFWIPTAIFVIILTRIFLEKSVIWLILKI